MCSRKKVQEVDSSSQFIAANYNESGKPNTTD